MDKKWYFIWIAVMNCLLACEIAGHEKLLIIDTANSPAFNYHTLISLANQAGFQTEFTTLYSLDEKNLTNYQVLFLCIDNQFLANNNYKQSFCIKSLSSITTFAQQPHKLLGILLPCATSQSERFFLDTIRFIDFITGRKIARKQIPIIRHFLTPTIWRSSWYDKSLFNKEPEQLKLLEPFRPSWDPTIHCLPGSFQDKLLEKTFFPLGYFIKNIKNQADLFISKLAVLDFCEIEEDIRVNPVDRAVRDKLLQASLTTLGELYELSKQNKTDTLGKDLLLPPVLTQQFERAQKELITKSRVCKLNKQFLWARHGIVAAWMDIDPYLKSEESLTAGIQSIMDAQLNVLWITLNPELYLSSRAQKPEEKERFFNDISRFTKALKKAYADKQKALPHIFINFDVTSNFKKEPVSTCVKDMFGKEYSKIPTPLDYEGLWAVEVIKPFDMLVTAWEASCGNGIPLSGIFFDLEMYHAQDQAAEYTNTMDFGDYAWDLYSQQRKNQDLGNLATTEQRVCYLVEERLMSDYHNFLKQHMRSIAKRIKAHMQARLPQVMFGVYTVTLPSSWFTQGFLAGLSTTREPLFLATFNNNAFSAMSWLQQQEIYCFHLGVVMLAKFQRETDFEYISLVRPYHDGIWINKFSRLMQSRNKEDWEWAWDPETTPLGTHLVTAGIAKALNNHKS